TAPSLTLPNVQTGDAADYSVVIANSCGAITSAPAKLILLTPPVITEHPLTQSANAGANITFTVSATGLQPLRYQWLFNGTEIKGATDLAFTLNNVQPANIGDYAVIVGNYGGAVTSEPAQLSVVVPEPISATTQLRTEFWVLDGPVHAVVEQGGVLYAGGSFNNAWPNTGSGAVIDLASGVPDGAFPEINGEVIAAASDGAGGWFIGGNFTAVGGQARNRLARLRADKTLDPEWKPSADRPVRAIVFASPNVYIAGHFTRINDQRGKDETRNRVAALDAGSGELKTWNPDASGPVHALAVSGGTIYAGGLFGRIGGQDRSNVAALSVSSGAALSGWNPGPDKTVFALALSEGKLYLGGEFERVANVARTQLAAVDAGSGGLITAFNPGADNAVKAIAVSGGVVYAGGFFETIGGQPRKFAAALNADTGAATSWNPILNNSVSALAAVGANVYLGGQFTTINGSPRNRIGAVAVAGNGSVIQWHPNAGAGVNVLAAFDSTIYAGGQFRTIGTVKRSRIAAFDVGTGRVTDWDPNAEDGDVRAVLVQGDRVYAGGEFTRIGGEQRSFIAALDTVTGRSISWAPNADGFVFALAAHENTVYAGGFYSKIGKPQAARTNLAALDIISANATSWDARADGRVFALAVQGNTVYVGGQFENIGGYARKNFAALETSNGNAKSWAANADLPVQAVHAAGGRLYVGGDFTSLASQTRTGLAQLDANTGVVQTWNPNLLRTNTPPVSSSVYAIVEAEGNTVYIGGVFNRIGDVPRNFIAALDRSSGAVTAWRSDANNRVSALAAQGRTIFAGGSFTFIGGLARQFMASILPKGPPVVTSPPKQETVNRDGSLTLRVNVVGQEPLSYQWRFNGSNIPNATLPTHTINNANPGHSGEYSVEVSNAQGSITTVAANVVVRVKPQIVGPSPLPGQTIAQSAAIGANITFNANADGSPPLTFQWRRNGVNIPGATHPAYTIQNAQPADSGSYNFVVQNAFDAVNSGVVSLVVEPGQTVAFANNYAQRGLLMSASGSGKGSNIGATPELGEGHHVGKVGGKSVWVTWRAPATGAATFNTVGSGFDTLLAVYTNSVANGGVRNLRLLAGDEEEGGFHCSSVTFNAVQGGEYQIAVDGFGGASGNIMLNWELTGSEADDVPVIHVEPIDRTVPQGETVTFSVLARKKDGGEQGLSYQWFFKDQVIAGATSALLVLNNVQPAQVGAYRCEVSTSTRRLTKIRPAHLEVGSQREAKTEDKFNNLTTTTFIGGGPALSSTRRKQNFASVAAGTLGTQVLANFGATKELGEENHGGIAGGASRWLTLSVNGEGTLVVEATSGTVRPVLAVYEGSDLLALNLIRSDSNRDGDNLASVSFPAVPGTDYRVVVDTVNGLIGDIKVNWRLGKKPEPPPGPAPTVTGVGGTSVTLRTDVVASPEPAFQWLRPDGSPIANETRSTLTFASFAQAQAGIYKVIISNFMGSITNEVTLNFQPPPKAKVRGKVRYYAGGKTVQGVTLNAGGGDSVVSTADGSFEFDLAAGANYTLTPAKETGDSAFDGLSTFDVSLTRRHLMRKGYLNSGHAVLAADVDGDGDVSTLDVSWIRRILLKKAISFPRPMWKFVRSDQSFPDLQKPWTYEKTRTVGALVADVSDLDFIGVKAGDVDGDWSPSSTPTAQGFGSGQRGSNQSKLLNLPQRAAPTVRLQLGGALSGSGEVISVPVRVVGFKNITSLQFTLQWNPEMVALLRQVAGSRVALGPENFSSAEIGQGRLMVSWDDSVGEGVTLADETVLFALEFRPASSATGVSSLGFVDAPLRREVSVDFQLGDLATENTVIDLNLHNQAPRISLVKTDSESANIKALIATVQGKTYTLETTETLGRPEWIRLHQVQGDGTAKVLIDERPRDAQRFYRVRVE
ncbi:MAG: hypothetical protein FJ403_22485, partial [Verrucomicrobia bacterium]|nr:hypothetical protein [Verrucomicrobiota bacterium]